MASGTFTLYRANLDDLRINDLVTGAANVKIALVTSSYTPSATTSGDDTWSDASGSEIANGNGYTTGGQALPATVEAVAVANGWKFSSGNPYWTATGGNIPAWRYAVMYYDGTLWGKTSPLIGYFVGDSTPADIPATSVGNTLTLNCPAGGWFDVTEA